jgi:hypothetical protein
MSCEIAFKPESEAFLFKEKGANEIRQLIQDF